MDKKENSLPGLRTVTVWDLPTRLFHWLLVALVVFSFTTATLGGNWMVYHVWSGETILTLLLFRFVWGCIGSAPSRFRAFLTGPATVMR
ncbi:MAG: cytochrome B, partial [Hyphomicrobiales bacterium]